MSLRFYFTPNQISLEQIGRVDVPDTRMSAWSGPFTGSEHSNGIDHHFMLSGAGLPIFKSHNSMKLLPIALTILIAPKDALNFKMCLHCSLILHR